MFSARKLLCKTCLATALALFTTTAGVAQTDATSCTEDAMLVFDGSGSMAEMGYNLLDRPRIFDARIALRLSLPRIAPLRRLGLIIYGPGPEGACNVNLRFRPMPNAGARIVADVEALAPSGQTPLTQAVGEAAETLNYREQPGVIVLVTDGKETCGGATCQVAGQLAADGAKLTVHVIGFKVRGKFFNWQNGSAAGFENGRTVARCLADRTGGKYVTAESVDELVAALQETLGCPIIGRGDVLNVLPDRLNRWG